MRLSLLHMELITLLQVNYTKSKDPFDVCLSTQAIFKMTLAQFDQ